MYKVESIGEIVAHRKIDFVYDDGEKESGEIKMGKPIKCDKYEDWYCPYEICTETKSKLRYMVGIDSLQAMDLSMNTLMVEVRHWDKLYKCKVFFLEEEGAGL